MYDIYNVAAMSLRPQRTYFDFTAYRNINISRSIGIGFMFMT